MSLAPARLAVAAAFCTAILFVVVSTLEAHAILLEASPAAKSTVQGPEVTVRLKFNSRIDGARSRISLLLPDMSEKVLAIEKQESPEVISSKATGLLSGAYRLRWQVLASDGHITRGEYGFDVR